MHFRSRTLRLALLASGLLLSACGALDPAGLVAASRLDPLGTPPENIAVAIATPEGIRLKNGDALLRIAFLGDSATSTLVIEETVPLRIALAADGVPGPERGPVYLATVGPNAAARFAAAQTTIRNARASGVEGAGSLTVDVRGGCLEGPLPDRFDVSTWLRTDPDAPFVPLTRSADLFGLLGAGEARALRARLAPCE